MKKLILLLAMAGCSAAEKSGGPFVDAVSSSSYGLNGGNAPALSFHKSTKQMRLNSNKGFRPTSDAVTTATYTFASSPASDRAVYKNSAGSFIGFIVSGNRVQKTVAAASEAAVDFTAPDGSYSK